MKKVFLFVILFHALILLTPSNNPDAEETQDISNNAVLSEGKETKARFYRETGDRYISGGDYERASEAYMEALQLSRNSFSIEERLQMAIRISWSKRYREALYELELILKEDPENLKALIYHSQILSWAGRLDEALKEIEIVLNKTPDNMDALLIKANILRWKGRDKEAIGIYERILMAQESFDARLGLTYSLINTGEFNRAEENIKLLTPQYPYQEKDLKELKDYYKRLHGPAITPEYSYYNDSEHNIVNRYYVKAHIQKEGFKGGIEYKEIHAKSPEYKNDATALNLNLSKRYRDVGAFASIGMVRLNGKEPTTFITGNVKVDLELRELKVGLNLSKDVFTDTVILIEKKIRFTEAGIHLFYPVFEKVSLEGSYRLRDYSDDNRSSDFITSMSYNILPGNPSIRGGYRFRYLDFKKQTLNGYFDPNNFYSHQLFLSLYLEKARGYLYLEPYGGYQSFERYGEKTHDFFTGGSLTTGYRIKDNLSIEFNAEGGDYAAGVAAGFRYWKAGLNLKTSF